MPSNSIKAQGDLRGIILMPNFFANSLSINSPVAPESIMASVSAAILCCLSTHDIETCCFFGTVENGSKAPRCNAVSTPRLDLFPSTSSVRDR